MRLIFRLIAGLLIGGQVEASHFRAVGFNIVQDNSTTSVKVTRTLAYRSKSSGYGRNTACTAADVTAQKESSFGMPTYENCALLSGGSCGQKMMKSAYIVTDLEDSLEMNDNFCYGYKTELFEKPTGPYKITWGSYAWVRFITDAGARAGEGGYGFTAYIYDVDNNTPQIKLPPIWKIMADCPSQRLDLSPIDLDGDRVECEFANADDARGAFRSNNYNSITLDTKTCILTYDGTQDVATTGVKPIAIQVKDYDENGVLRSSMPVQFLASVWTPVNTNFNHRQRSGQLYAIGKPFVYEPALFSSDEDDHDHDGDYYDDVEHPPRRIRRATPAYCDMEPILIDPSPPAGEIFDASEGITITVAATPSNIDGQAVGSITRFTYNSPMGMTCTDLVTVDNETKAVCTWNPTSDQMGQVFNFCFMADDSVGMSTERRCVKLSTNPTVIPAIDECSSNAHTCDENALCTDTETSYTCACAAGYNGDGFTCTGKCIMITQYVSIYVFFN